MTAQPIQAQALFAPFRAIVLTMIAGGTAVQIVDLVSGDYLRGATIGAIIVIGLISWRLATRGAIELAAALLFCSMVVAITLRPGIIDTPMQDKVLEQVAPLRGMTVEELSQARLKTVPLGRVGTPEETAALTWFLLSDDAGYMTGQAVNLTGGLVMW